MADFVQVPPQSTGAKIGTVTTTTLPFDNALASFDINDTVTGAASGATAVITGINKQGANAGELYLGDVTGTFVNNEVLQVNLVNIASANLAEPPVTTELQKMVITDPDNPSQQQRIDRFGATVNTFSDGSPVFGAFGTLTTGEPQISRVYRFATDLRDDDWSTFTNGTATVTWDGNKTACVQTIGSDPGDKSSRTTNYYHPYVPGVGMNVEFTTQLGDTGKENCVRRWGYFDDNDGFFFELNGTQLYVVKRSSVTGTPVDTKVAQEDFNRDEVNGTDNLGFALDLSKGNMYWIDIQWYGAGRLRYGIYEPGGTRVTLHEFQHSNSAVEYPYSRTASLPVRFEQENTGVTSGTSEILNTGAVVKYAYRTTVTGDKNTLVSPLRAISPNVETPVMTIRPKTTYNGYTNRSIIKGMSVILTNVSNGVVLFRVRGCIGPALINANFVSHAANSITEEDVAATGFNPAFTRELSSFVVSPDSSLFQRDADDRILPTFEIFLNADGVTQPCLLLTAELITGSNAQVLGGVNWEEIKY